MTDNARIVREALEELNARRTLYEGHPGIPKAFTALTALETELSASQAREREAVERAEKAEHHERVAQDALSSADCRYAGRVAEMGGSHCPIGEPCDRCAAERRERKLESALAAARKALEDALQGFNHLHAMIQIPAADWVLVDRINAEIRKLQDARAALNGDSHD